MIRLIKKKIIIMGMTENKTLIIAHRGISREAPENTIPAFKLAFEREFDGIEADFRLTKDGEIVCIHDRSTFKVARIRKIVKKSTLAELKKLDVGLWFSKSWQGLTIPTLREVLQVIPQGKKLFMEIKCGVEIIPKLLQILNNSQFPREQLIVISFNSKVIQTLKKYAPFLKTLLLSSLEINYQSRRLIPSVKNVLKKLQLIQADGFSSQAHKLLDQEFVDKIQKAGYEYHVWTVDDAETLQKFRQMGVNSITTNLTRAC
jgi:glycerophosphoryl diester phosphodiesterase